MKYSVLEWIILSIVLTFVVALFSVCPIYFFATVTIQFQEYTENRKYSQNTTTKIYYNFNETVQFCNGSNSTEVLTLCDTYGIAETLSRCDGCSEETYTGSVCIESLLAWQECAITGMDSALLVSVSEEQAKLENDAEMLESNLGFASKECQVAVVPFFCLYAFPIYDYATTRLYQPTRVSCELIRDETCFSEWSVVNSVNPDLLPDCSNLPNARPIDSSNECFNETDVMDLQLTDNENFTCRYDFIEQNSTCWPRCDRFTQFPDTLSKTVDYIIVIGVTIGGLLACIVIIIGIFDYRKVFVFPAVYVMFLNIDYLFIGVVVLISYYGRDSLMCGDIRLDKSRENPTVFCTLTGFVLQYGIVQMSIWWFTHVGIFSFHVLFPFHARTMKNTKKMKVIYIFTVVAGIFVPLPAVLASLIDYDLRFLQTEYPTTLCSTSSYTLLFYSYILPGTFAGGIGSLLLVLVIWNIHKHQGLFKQKSKKRLMKISITSAEKRLIIIFLSFLLYGILFSVYGTVIGVTREEATEKLENYFTCELFGHEPGKCDRSEIEFTYVAYFKIFAYSPLILLPVCTLNFVLNWKKLKQCFKRKDYQNHKNSLSSISKEPKSNVPNFVVMATIPEEPGSGKETELNNLNIE